MGDLALIVFNADSKDGASAALDAAKKLDREGWIELIDYALYIKDEKGHVKIRGTEDESAEKIAAAAVGVTGGVVGAVAGGPAGAVAGAAAGALVGTGSFRLMEAFVEADVARNFTRDLAPNSSAFAVTVEERYAERLNEEFDKLGRTIRTELKRAERDAEFQAYIQRSKNRIQSLQNDINTQLTKGRSATGAEKAKIEASIAAKRDELEARREKLEEHLKAISSDLKAEIREMSFQLELAGLAAKDAMATTIDRLHRQLNSFTDDLENLVEGQIETLREQASELKEKAAKASGENKVAIEQHVVSIEARLRKERRALVDSFEERFLQTKQWFADLQVRATLGRADLRDKLQASIKKVQQSLAELKVQVRMKHGGNERAWKDIRQGFNKAWKDLADAFDRASREHA
jgi:uncharacterized membrane protein/ElaB/YqjD/DUF883 family membrane-anchored ribosome-binding protein